MAGGLFLEKMQEKTMNIFADGLTKVTLSNHNFRFTLVQNGPDNQQLETGTLIIPAGSAVAFVNAMAKSLKHFDEQIKAQMQTQKEA